MAAEQPPDGSGLRPRRGWWRAAGLVALLLAIGLVVLWVQAPGLYGRGDAAKTAAATTRGAILTVTAALIAAATAGAGVLIARTLAKTRQANRQADQRNRYAKAIKQLGSSHLDVRLSGIYTLERIAKTSERDQHTVVEVLRTFIPKHRRLHPSRGHHCRSRTTVRTATDVQAAIDVLLRLPTHPGLLQVQLDHAHLPHARLAGADLSGANLAGADLSGANLAGADLSGANLAGATLSGAWLGRANLTGAEVSQANLTGALLSRAKLTGTILVGASLTGAILNHASLTGAWLLKTNLTGAMLTQTDLSGAWLVGATLSGADLAGATLSDTNLAGADLTTVRSLTQQQLNSARGDDHTKLSAGLQRPAHWPAGLAVPPTADS